VIRLPHIANFDDFDPLRAEPGVGLRYISSAALLGQPDAVILPGTKSTVADLEWLRTQGFAGAIHTLAKQGVAIVGICGGYQMLGRMIRDPHEVESRHSGIPGLAMLPVETTFEITKATYQVTAKVSGGPRWLSILAGQEVEGYEIHLGRSSGSIPWLEINRRNGQAVSLPDGAVSADGKVWGCYLHGLFANATLRRAWIGSLRNNSPKPALGNAPLASLHDSLEQLADAVEGALDMNQLTAILQEQN